MERVHFKELKENLWLIEFSVGNNKRRVIEGQPWLFDCSLLVLQYFDGNTPPLQI